MKMQSMIQKQLDILLNLQEIESETRRIKKVLEEVDSKISAQDKKREEFKQFLDKEESDLNSLRMEFKENEETINKNSARLKKSREDLKKVKTNREYQVLLREIDDNTKRNAKLEDMLIEQLEIIEQKESELEKINAEYLQIESQSKSKIEEIRTNSKQDFEKMNLSLKKRDKIAKLLHSKLLARFNNILKITGGIAIVPVNNGVCKGCYLNLPPQLYIEIQRGDELHFCPQCQRFIYWPNDNNGH